jgi:hypothetical protein
VDLEPAPSLHQEVQEITEQIGRVGALVEVQAGAAVEVPADDEHGALRLLGRVREGAEVVLGVDDQ